MNDDDLYAPKLTPPPTTAPIVRGAAVALVTVALATSLGCTPSNPGAPLDAITPGVDGAAHDAGNPGTAFDGGLYPPDTNDHAPDMGLAPGVPALDAGTDADNPGDHT